MPSNGKRVRDTNSGKKLRDKPDNSCTCCGCPTNLHATVSGFTLCSTWSLDTGAINGTYSLTGLENAPGIGCTYDWGLVDDHGNFPQIHRIEDGFTVQLIAMFEILWPSPVHAAVLISSAGPGTTYSGFNSTQLFTGFDGMNPITFTDDNAAIACDGIVQTGPFVIKIGHGATVEIWQE